MSKTKLPFKVDPLDFLTIANQLYASQSEAERRTSIGRSYYAFYNQLIAALSPQGVSFDKERNHGRLVYYLTKCKPDLGSDLKTLRNYRNDADYDMSKSIDARCSEFAFKKARSAIDKFSAFTLSDIRKLADCIRYLAPYR